MRLFLRARAVIKFVMRAVLCLMFCFMFNFYHTNNNNNNKKESHTLANESGEEAEKETMGLIDIGLPQSIK